MATAVTVSYDCASSATVSEDESKGVIINIVYHSNEKNNFEHDVVPKTGDIMCTDVCLNAGTCAQALVAKSPQSYLYY